MSDFATVQGVAFEYPILGGDKLYTLIPSLNTEFSLEMHEEDFRNGIAHIGLDGYIVLCAFNNAGELVYTFKNTSYDQSKVISEWVTPPYRLYPFSSIFINFSDELEFLKSFGLNQPSEYNLATAPNHRLLKRLLFQYSYGDYPIIGEGASLAGFVVKHFGPGTDLQDTHPDLVNYKLVVIIDIPTTNGWKELILKTENAV